MGKTMGMEYPQEFTAVVCLDDGDGMGKVLLKLKEYPTCLGAGETGHHGAVSITGGHINDAHKAPPFPKNPERDRIHLHVPGCCCPWCIPSPLASKSAFVIALDLPRWEPVIPEDELANRRGSHGGNTHVETIGIQQGLDGVLVHGVLSCADALHKRKDGRVRVHRSKVFGAGGSRNEYFNMVVSRCISVPPHIENAFGNAKGRYCSFPSKVSGVFNDFHPKSNWIVGIIHGRGGQCFHPGSIDVSGVFHLSVCCVMDICWHIFTASHSNMYRDLITYDGIGDMYR